MIKRLVIKYLKDKHEYINHQMLSLETQLEHRNGKMSEEYEYKLVQRYEYWKNIELSFFETIKFLEKK